MLTGSASRPVLAPALAGPGSFLGQQHPLDNITTRARTSDPASGSRSVHGVMTIVTEFDFPH